MSASRTLAAALAISTFAASVVRADTPLEPAAPPSAAAPAPTSAPPAPRVQVQRRGGALVEGERVEGVAGYITLRLADGSLLSLPPDEVVELRAVVGSAPPSVPPAALAIDAPDALLTSFESDGNPLLVGLASQGAALDLRCRMPCDLSVPRGVYDVYIGEHVPTRFVDRLDLDGGELVLVEEDTRPGLRLGGVVLAALGIGIGALMIAKRPEQGATPVLGGGITSIVVGVGAGVTLLSWPSRRSAIVHPR